MLSWGDIAGTICAIIGIVCMALGGLSAFAGGMSDAPAEGNAGIRFGCTLFVVGAVCVVVGGWRLAV